MAQPAPVSGYSHGHLIQPADGVSRVSDDIWCLSCPVPFDVGTVNVYLLLGEPLTLIDTGSRINWDIDDLFGLITRTGTEPTDIAQLILTHRHIDHFGLARDFAERTGARVIASRIDGPFMAEWGEKIVGNREQFRNQGRAFGIPEDQFMLNERWASAIVHAAEAVGSQQLLGEGDVLRAGGRDLRVIEAPGHTEGLITFFDEGDGTYLSNDHVLKHITPNPDVYDYDPNHLRSGLPDYVASLRKVRDLPARLVLPGHGFEMTDLAGRVDDILEHHDRRAARVEAFVRERPSVIFELVERVWPEIRPRDTHLAVREIIGHLVLLEDEGKITHAWDGERLVFSGA